MGIIHETGHALRASLPAPWRNQPVGLARSIAMHEPITAYEMQACRSAEFLTF